MEVSGAAVSGSRERIHRRPPAAWRHTAGIAILGVAVASPLLAGPVIPWNTASEHVGRRITIEGRASDLKSNEAVQKAYLGLD